MLLYGASGTTTVLLALLVQKRILELTHPGVPHLAHEKRHMMLAIPVGRVELVEVPLIIASRDSKAAPVTADHTEVINDAGRLRRQWQAQAWARL